MQKKPQLQPVPYKLTFKLVRQVQEFCRAAGDLLPMPLVYH